ncbi:MAG: class I SAM-dependent methyltransferase [Nitrospinota bacterium]
MEVSPHPAAWQRETRVRPFAAGEDPSLHARMGEAWLTALRQLLPQGIGHLDVGCGSGRMTWMLACRWFPSGWSTGVDREEAPLAAARENAARLGLGGARFLRGDVEGEEYSAFLGGRIPGLVTSHLCMSAAIAGRAWRALPPGGAFAFAALHPDLWKETGRASRFALGEEEAERLLSSLGFSLLFRRVETEVLQFREAGEAAGKFFEGGRKVPRWREDGRWDALLSYLDGGGTTLTARAQLQCIARKERP